MIVFSKLWALLTPQQKRFSFLLLFLVILGTIMELIGLGLIVPLVALLTHSDLSAKYPAIAPFLERLGNPTREELLAMTLYTLVGIYFIKTAYLVFLSWLQAGFNLKILTHLSKELFTVYLKRPWILYKKNNSSLYIQNIINETNILITQGFSSALELITNALLFASITILLLLAEPVGTITIIAILALAVWGFQYLSRIRVSHWGRIRKEHEALRLKCVQQGLNSAKDIKIRSCENFFIKQFDVHSQNLIHSGQWQSTLRRFPRYFFEFLAVLGLVISIFIMIGSGKPLESIAPIVGLFAAVFIKLMPSINNILTGLHSLRYIRPTIDTIHQELCLTGHMSVPATGDKIPDHSKIELKDVKFTYPEAATAALKGINLEIPFGSSVGIIGTSGAGKSTLIDIILGLLKPDSGSIKVGNIDIQQNISSWMEHIGYVPQSIYLLDDTLRRNIAFGINDYDIDEEAISRAVKDAQLEELVNSLPDGLDSIVGEAGGRLSGGEKQRVGLARALYKKPSVLLLDEATASLDPETEIEVMKAVNKLKGNHTILIITHKLSTIEGCDMVVRISEGQVTEINSIHAPRTAHH